MPTGLAPFDHRAEVAQPEQIEEYMQQVPMNKNRGDEAPDLPGSNLRQALMPHQVVVDHLRRRDEKVLDRFPFRPAGEREGDFGIDGYADTDRDEDQSNGSYSAHQETRPDLTRSTDSLSICFGILLFFLNELARVACSLPVLCIVWVRQVLSEEIL